ncbi:MAG: hypothetical protein ABFS38_13920 [Bacteroidota bacterium]
MMKLLVSLASLFIFIVSWSQEEADSSKAKLEANATISLNSNGIAYVPAFSLDKPAIIAAFTFAKNRFSYDPTLSYSLDLKPWIIDNWLHYKIVDKPAFELKAGALFSAFFSEYEAENEVIWQAQRYFAIEFTGVYLVAPNSTLSLTYLHDRGQDPGTLIGHYINLGVEKSEIAMGKKGLLSTALQLFYINYTGNSDGLFISPKISFSLRNIPSAIYFQAIQALDSNITPFPGFKWNLGLSYTL